jgi:hypothetical protein
MSTGNRSQPMTMTDREFRAEIWRALIIVLRAMIKRYGFRPPQFD